MRDAPDLHKMLSIMLQVWVAEHGPIEHPDEVISPLVRTISDTIDALECPSCRMAFTIKVANSFLPQELQIPMPLELAEHINPHEVALATMVPEGRA